MAYAKILDMHVHTDNSHDGNHSTMFLCERAEMAGMRAIAFTDHIEIDLYEKGNFERTARQSFFEVTKARSAFRGKLIVCTGIELGQAIYDLPTADALLRRIPYDFVLGSLHNLEHVDDFAFLAYTEETVEPILRLYFEEIIRLCEWGGFDCLSHLTYPLRYIVGEHKMSVDLRHFSDQIDTILHLLIDNGKALEINTSGLRQPLGETMPGKDILLRYRELGGELITIGSDAHFAAHLGMGITEGMALAEACGFRYVALYQQREPTLIPLA